MHVFATCIFYTRYILELDSCVYMNYIYEYELYYELYIVIYELCIYDYMDYM